ncbi:MAG: hypothetical protein AAF580_06925 [Pseudomonadota bacterium]
MNVEQLMADFQHDDLQWLLPVLAGLLIIVGGLLTGIIRGMTAGVIVALFFGGLMAMSPVILNALQRGGDRVGLVSADVARSAAALAELNNDVVVDLSRVVTSLRTTLDGLAPLVGEGSGVAADTAQRFTRGLSDTEDRLDTAISSLSQAATLRQRLSQDVQTLEAEIRRASASR